MRPPQQVWLESFRPGPEGRSFRFSRPLGQVVAAVAADVAPAFARVERAVRDGAHAVAVIGYEAAPAFDGAVAAGVVAGPLPAAWFGLYAEREAVVAGAAGPPPGPFRLGPWRAGLDAAAHAAGVAAIRDYIGAGDIYQANFTFPVAAPFSGDAAGLYRALCAAQGSAAFCAFIDLGDAAVVSASPELFLAVDGDRRLRTRPMKGTRRRGRWSEEDEDLRRALAASAKDRAENLMIVDLLRSDLGRVAAPGSVAVDALWEVEAYDTVWQMTSSLSARARPATTLFDLFAALFPCGSVTGAPKVRATQVIRQLETGPRGAYTGAIGCVSPAAGSGGVDAVFSVAIRTVVVDRRSGQAVAGVGGGITWDSEAAAEYDECRHKVRFLERVWPAAGGAPTPDFELFETLLFEPQSGYYLVERHLRRLAASARYFGFAFDAGGVRARLHAAAAHRHEPARVRLSLGRDGAVTVSCRAVGDAPARWTAVVAEDAVDATDPFLYHKTTRRGVYERALARARAAGADEVILRNADGELTECAVGNLVLVHGGRRRTPALDCGLLPGTFRQELLENGGVEEARLTAADLADADDVFLINSVRRWVPLTVLPTTVRTNAPSQERAACTG